MASILTFCSTILSGILSGIYSDILPDILSGICNWHIFWHSLYSFWHSIWYILKDALWLNVRQEILWSGAYGGGPAGITLIQGLPFGSGGEHCDLERAVGGGGGPADIKSNNPHLTGGENRKSVWYTDHHRCKDINSGMITKISMSSDGSQMVAVSSSPGYIMIREPGTSTTITTMTNTTTASTRTAVISVDELGTARWYDPHSYQLKTRVTHNKLDGDRWGMMG